MLRQQSLVYVYITNTDTKRSVESRSVARNIKEVLENLRLAIAKIPKNKGIRS